MYNAYLLQGTSVLDSKEIVVALYQPAFIVYLVRVCVRPATLLLLPLEPIVHYAERADSASARALSSGRLASLTAHRHYEQLLSFTCLLLILVAGLSYWRHLCLLSSYLPLRPPRAPPRRVCCRLFRYFF